MHVSLTLRSAGKMPAGPTAKMAVLLGFSGLHPLDVRAEFSHFFIEMFVAAIDQRIGNRSKMFWLNSVDGHSGAGYRARHQKSARFNPIGDDVVLGPM